MSESEVLGRLFSLAAELLGVIHQIEVSFESKEAGAAEGKVTLVYIYRSPVPNGFVLIHAHLWHRKTPALTLPCAICTRWR